MDASSSPKEGESSPIAGAFNFKDWWITVWLHHPSITMPDGCACCGTMEDLHKKHISLERSSGAVTYSICQYCIRHSRLDDVSGSLSIGLAVILLLVGHFLLFGFAIPTSLFLYTIYFGVFFVLAAAIYLLAGLLYGWRSDCAEKTWPVEEVPDPDREVPLGPDSLRTDEKNARKKSREFKEKVGMEGAGLRMKNLRYAKEMIRLNNGSTEDITRVREAF